jgi:D-alanine-D-alanine ligase
MLIGFTYDLRKDYLARGYSEEDVAEFDSEGTIDAIAGAIESLGHTVVRVGNAWELCRRLVAGEKWDLVFNVTEGLRGRSREAQVPAICELYNINYTFSDPLVSAATLDKAVAKRLVRDSGLYTAPFAVVNDIDDLDAACRGRPVCLPKEGEHAGSPLPGFPLFAKPLAEGTGKGITNTSKIESPAQLREVCAELLKRYKQPVLLEEYLPGREFTVGILGTGQEAKVLGTMEIELIDASNNSIYSYASKELCETQVRYTKATGSVVAEVEKLALRSYQALECRDAGRVDIRLDKNGTPCFLEVNPLAGMHPSHSDLPMIATQEQMSYQKLIDSIIKSAIRRA